MKKSTQFASVLFLIALTAVGCVHKTVYTEGSATAKNDKAAPTAQVTVEWLKSRDGKIDIMFALMNTSKAPLYVKQSSFHLEFNGEKASALNVPSFIEVQAGERREIVAVFKLTKGQPMAGNAVFTLDPIVSGAIEKPGATLGPIKLVLPIQE